MDNLNNQAESPTDTERRKAKEGINLLTTKVVEPEFIERGQEPYDDKRQLDVYRTNKGEEGWREWRIDPSTGKVMGSGLVLSTTPDILPSERLSIAELRQIALELIGRQIDGFERLLPSLHPLEANDRRSIYFFRWEDLSELLSEAELPSFIQVGLFADGSLSNFTDTLSRHMVTSKEDEGKSDNFTCPKCHKEIDEVHVVSSCWQKASVNKAGEAFEHGSTEEIMETDRIDCSECGANITEHIEEL